MVFHWSLGDSKSPQVSRAQLSFLAVLNNVVVWKVSTRPLTSNSFSPFSNPFVTVPNAPITIGIIFTCMFHIIIIIIIINNNINNNTKRYIHKTECVQVNEMCAIIGDFEI